jgi:hypothetical protein
MQRSRPQAPHSGSEPLKQVGRLETDSHEFRSQLIKSAEFTVIDDLIAQIALFRKEDHKISWAALSALFQAPQSILY